jgi:hypothetical protein
MDFMGMLAGMPDQPDASREQQALQAHARRVQAETTRLEQAERRTVLLYAWLYCRCNRRFTWNDGESAQPPQAGCIVHGQFMITPEGEFIG